MYGATTGANVKWGAQISNGGTGTTGPPAGDGPEFCHTVKAALHSILIQCSHYR